MPASSTPCLTSAARSIKCMLHGLPSYHTDEIPTCMHQALMRDLYLGLCLFKLDSRARQLRRTWLGLAGLHDDMTTNMALL